MSVEPSTGFISNKKTKIQVKICFISNTCKEKVSLLCEGLDITLDLHVVCQNNISVDGYHRFHKI